MFYTMELPKDIWNNVLSYFHSPYKCPSHYNAIMDNNDFYYIRNHNKIRNRLLSRGYIVRNSYYANILSGFYIQMICMGNVNTTFSKKNNNTFKNRGTAKYANKNVLNDFIEIINEYKKTQYQLYTNLNYLQN